jgi:hypothetical protein
MGNFLTFLPNGTRTCNPDPAVVADFVGGT